MNHIEDVLTAIKTVISSNISTKLSTIATAYGDGITLTAPKKYYINEIYVIDNLPCIQIIPDRTVTNPAANKWDDDVDSVIIVAHNISYDGKPETLAKVTYRYVKALSEIIADNHTLNTNTYGWKRDNITYQPMMSDGNILKQQVWINTTIMTVRTV